MMRTRRKFALHMAPFALYLQRVLAWTSAFSPGTRRLQSGPYVNKSRRRQQQ